MAHSLDNSGGKSLFRRIRSWTKETKLFILALVLIIIGTIGATITLTDGNRIEVREITIPTQDGQWVVADLYKPKSATSVNKAPAIVVCPGFQRSKETQSNMSLELARRGIVVITIDPYAQGDSSSSNSTQSATTEGYGIIPIVEYIYSTPNLNYIDKTRIGSAGHSAGGNAALRAAAYFGAEVIDGVVTKSKLSAVYVSGYVITLTDSVLSSVRSSIGIDYAYYDEGAYRNENATDPSLHDADMSIAPEAIRLINSGLSMNGETTVTSVEIDRIYGSPFNNTMRVVHNEKTLHSFQVYDTQSTANIMDYFELTFDLNFLISSNNQTFMLKEIFQGLMLVGAMVFIFGFGGLLLKTKFFHTLVHPLPPKAIKQTKKGRIIFWSTFAASAIIACLSFIPMAQYAQVWFPDAQNGIQTWFFPQRMTNAVLLWALLNGIVGFLLFFLFYYLNNKKHSSLDALKIKAGELGKTLLLAITIFTAFYLIDYICYHLFHVDFRFTFIAARTLGNTNMYLVALMYIPLFFIFYLSNSIRVNIMMRVDGWSERKSQLIACLGNSVGLILIVAIQYIVYVASGTVMWTTEWLYVNILFGLIPMMFILPIFNRYFFNRTGRVYTGAMISCMIFIMMTLTNTVCYIPL